MCVVIRATAGMLVWSHTRMSILSTPHTSDLAWLAAKNIRFIEFAAHAMLKHQLLLGLCKLHWHISTPVI